MTKKVGNLWGIYGPLFGNKFIITSVFPIIQSGNDFVIPMDEEWRIDDPSSYETVSRKAAHLWGSETDYKVPINDGDILALVGPETSRHIKYIKYNFFDGWIGHLGFRIKPMSVKSFQTLMDSFRDIVISVYDENMNKDEPTITTELLSAVEVISVLPNLSLFERSWREIYVRVLAEEDTTRLLRLLNLLRNHLKMKSNLVQTCTECNTPFPNGYTGTGTICDGCIDKLREPIATHSYRLVEDQ